MKLVHGMALAAALAGAGVAQAQQDTLRRTSSDTRISVSKGEVVSARADTIYVTRADTVRITTLRVDTVRVELPRVEASVAGEPRGNTFWGVFAGTTAPSGTIDRLYTKGFHGGGMLGWEGALLGARLDASMSQVNREQGRLAELVGTGTPLLLSAAASGKVRPLSFGGWALYGVAGLNYNRYRRIATAASSGEATHCGAQYDGKGGCYTAAEDARWSDKFGFNAGAGVDFHIGSQDMFVEARWMALQTNGARTWFIPVSLGVRYF